MSAVIVRTRRIGGEFWSDDDGHGAVPVRQSLSNAISEARQFLDDVRRDPLLGRCTDADIEFVTDGGTRIPYVDAMAVLSSRFSGTPALSLAFNPTCDSRRGTHGQPSS